MQTTKRYSSPWRRLGLALAVAMVAATSLFASGALPASAAPATAGSGSYAFGTVPATVSPGGTVQVPVIGSSLVNGSDGTTTYPPVVCYTVTGSALDVSATSGALGPFAAATQYIQVTALGTATIGHTITVTLSTSPCPNPNTHVSDTAVVTGTNPVTITVAALGAPTVTSISPTSGAQGATLTINGTNFTNSASVTFSGVPTVSGIAIASFVNQGQITVVVPAGLTPTHIYDIIVSTAGGNSATSANDQFTLTSLASATLTSISPPGGSTAGSNTVTLTGTNLTGATSVTFGSTTTTTITSNTGTTLTVIAPPGTGTVNVTVNTPQGNPVLTSAYTYTTGPVVTSISPTTCPTTGGQSVTINGFNLGTTLGATQVTVGGTPGIGTTATVTSVSVTGTTVTFLCPALAGNSYHVVVTVANVSSPQTNADLLTYASTGPAITSIFPTTGPTVGGTSVTITGVNLSSPTSVTFGGVAASFTPISATQITAVSPAHAGGASVEVQVTTSAGTTVLTPSVDTFIYADFGAPTITSITPVTDANACGTIIPVTITGTNFTVNGSLMSLTFGGVAAQFSVPSTTQINAILPAHAAGAVNVVVTTNSGSLSFTATNAFTYTCSSAPTVSSVSPSSGAPGSTVTITGSGFTGVICPSGVTFGGVQATSCTVSGDTSITAVVPTNLPSGTTDVRVTNASGTSAINTATDSFTNTQSGATVSYTLYAGFTLIGWVGQDGISAQAALQGPNPPVGNPPTNNVSGVVTVIWRFDASTQTFKAFFPGQNVPGANDFTTLSKGTGYFIGTPPGTATTTWVVQAG